MPFPLPGQTYPVRIEDEYLCPKPVAMNRSTLRTCVRIAAAMALAVALAGGLAPTARASCGDYVTVHQQSQAPVAETVYRPGAHSARLAASPIDLRPSLPCRRCPASPGEPCR